LAGLSVLILETQKKQRDRLTEKLGEAGYDVRIADSAQSLLSEVSTDPPHAIILDIDLAGDEGIHVLKAIHDILPELPVIVEAIDPTVEQAVEVMRRGAYNYISKRSPLATAVEVLSHALERERMEAETKEKAKERKIRTFDDPASLASIDRILARHHYSDSMLISYMQDIQDELRYLPQEALRFIARRLNVSLPRVYGIATFYKSFSLRPRGKYMIQVCMGTACHVRGSGNILQSFERELGIPSGETTYDERFSLESVRCVGCCGLAPVFIINGKFYGNMTQEQVPKVLSKYE
jgi:NADH:ubiquinone oxidoreductase subunit E/CheY-like chemotaxis protein